MDILRAIYKARPDVAWKNNSVNGFSLDTIKKAYIGEDFPSLGELDTAWLACLQEEKKTQAKEEAYKRIIAILPEWKQRNYTAKGLELTEKKADGIALSETELGILDAIKTIWSLIEQVRTASDNIEAELGNIGDIQEIEAYEIVNNVLWP